jgi:flagellar M-ring protein FliF
MENARYQHALETELARTIASVQNVQGARVHLAMSRQSAFVTDRRPASASVFLQIKAGRRLDDEQVQAISNLVASSIPELSTAQVTVIDQAGRLLSSPGSASEAGMRDRMFEFAHRLEESYANRIQELLTPLVGPGRVRAQVVAQVDMATTESTREQYNPQSQVVRSESTSEESAKNGGGTAGGVPGALTNQPPQPGVALAPGQQPTVAQSGPNAAGATPGAPGAAGTEVTGPDSKSRQSTRNYEIALPSTPQHRSSTPRRAHRQARAGRAEGATATRRVADELDPVGCGTGGRARLVQRLLPSPQGRLATPGRAQRDARALRRSARRP